MKMSLCESMKGSSVECQREIFLGSFAKTAIALITLIMDIVKSNPKKTSLGRQGSKELFHPTATVEAALALTEILSLWETPEWLHGLENIATAAPESMDGISIHAVPGGEIFGLLLCW